MSSACPECAAHEREVAELKAQLRAKTDEAEAFRAQATQYKALYVRTEKELRAKTDEVEDLQPKLYEVVTKLRNSETAHRAAEKSLKAKTKALERLQAAGAASVAEAASQS